MQILYLYVHKQSFGLIIHISCKKKRIKNVEKKITEKILYRNTQDLLTLKAPNIIAADVKLQDNIPDFWHDSHEILSLMDNSIYLKMLPATNLGGALRVKLHCTQDIRQEIWIISWPHCFSSQIVYTSALLS